MHPGAYYVARVTRYDAGVPAMYLSIFASRKTSRRQMIQSILVLVLKRPVFVVMAWPRARSGRQAEIKIVTIILAAGRPADWTYDECLEYNEEGLMLGTRSLFFSRAQKGCRKAGTPSKQSAPPGRRDTDGALTNAHQRVLIRTAMINTPDYEGWMQLRVCVQTRKADVLSLLQAAPIVHTRTDFSVHTMRMGTTTVGHKDTSHFSAPSSYLLYQANGFFGSPSDADERRRAGHGTVALNSIQPTSKNRMARPPARKRDHALIITLGVCNYTTEVPSSQSKPVRPASSRMISPLTEAHRSPNSEVREGIFDLSSRKERSAEKRDCRCEMYAAEITESNMFAGLARGAVGGVGKPEKDTENRNGFERPPHPNRIGVEDSIDSIIGDRRAFAAALNGWGDSLLDRTGFPRCFGRRSELSYPESWTVACKGAERRTWDRL
ncbi:hypothetical protein DFP72DRAFT_1049675 [Ephemerocybe angulata]|uniref:Uncharacterized protein n=1 Tax=Ephemerocybe angulata TaxID=980116 RepID=A0A8H6HLB5_9AGAR|nr:hypothetical protein DFP72DRAFT_1049675 [Tulosesus angulatus]